MSALDDVEISRKTSILFSLSEKFETQRKSIVSEKGKEPKDCLFIVHVLCFLVGFMNVMPMVFFSNAQTYWMFKFRNTTLDEETTEGKDRTTLQSYFQSVQMVAGTVPNLIFTVISTLYGHKISAVSRSIGALTIQCIIFATFTIFTKINTDSWQTLFFILTLGMFAVNSACTSTFQMSSVILMAKLPSVYMLFFLMGQNGTFITSALQIIALSVTDRSLTAGLIYFGAGTFLIALTLFYLLVGRTTEIFKYYGVGDVREDQSEELKWSECKILIKQIWPSLYAMFITILTLSCSMGVITLIVSENEAEKTPWTAKYFIPVTAFLLSEIASIMGRLASKNFTMTHSNKWWYVTAITARAVISIPFYIFCRAEPRHLPIIFHHDWQYITGHLIFAFLVGFFMNVSFMSIKTMSEKNTELGYKLMVIVASVTSAATTANGILIVKLL